MFVGREKKRFNKDSSPLLFLHLIPSPSLLTYELPLLFSYADVAKTARTTIALFPPPFSLVFPSEKGFYKIRSEKEFMFLRIRERIGKDVT